MLLDWFNAREAVEVGTSLADYYLPKGDREACGHSLAPRSRDTGNDLQKFIQRAARDVRPLKLNLFTRAKLLNSFKWRLLESGCDRNTVDNLTDLLMLQISGGPLSAAPHDGGVIARPSERSAALRRVPSLMAEGDAQFAEGDYEAAAARYRDVVEINPRHVLAQSNLGAALVHLGSYDDADQVLRRALALKPNFVRPYVQPREPASAKRTVRGIGDRTPSSSQEGSAQR